MRENYFFFIVGCPRSGTTLLSVLLDRHHRLCIPPETAFFDEIAPALPCANASELGKRLDAWHRLGEMGLTSAAVLRELSGLNFSPANVLTALLKLYAVLRGKPRCGEKTPQHFRHVPAILQDYPQAKVIVLMRDGRDVALSLLNMPWWKHSLAETAELWKTYIGLMETYQRQYPDRIEVIRYECLALQPEAVLTRLMPFLGEDFEPDQLNTTLESRIVLQRNLAWKGQALTPVNPLYIGHRRKTALQTEIAFLERSMADELGRHGYLCL